MPGLIDICRGGLATPRPVVARWRMLLL